MSRSVPLRWVALGALLAALVLAGVVSFYADGDPDGLNRVAQDEGFAGTETEHATGDGPLAGYESKGIDDARVSKAVAGVTGTLVVLVLGAGVAYAVRRRTRAGATDAGPVPPAPAPHDTRA